MNNVYISGVFSVRLKLLIMSGIIGPYISSCILRDTVPSENFLVASVEVLKGIPLSRLFILRKLSLVFSHCKICVVLLSPVLLWYSVALLGNSFSCHVLDRSYIYYMALHFLLVDIFYFISSVKFLKMGVDVLYALYSLLI